MGNTICTLQIQYIIQILYFLLFANIAALIAKQYALACVCSTNVIRAILLLLALL